MRTISGAAGFDRFWGCEGMIVRVVRLGPGECSNIETGARFFATFALPGVDEAEARQDAAAAMVTSYLHAANRIDQTEAPFLDSRLNAFAQRSPEWAKPVFNAVKRRLRYRLLLARGLRPWILQGLGQAPKTVPTIKKFTQRQISLFLNGNDAQRADNFQKRVWRPSRPVIHVAVACDLALCETGGEQTVISVNWPAAGSVDTEIRCFMELEVSNGETEVRPRVQA